MNYNHYPHPRRNKNRPRVEVLQRHGKTQSSIVLFAVMLTLLALFAGKLNAQTSLQLTGARLTADDGSSELLQTFVCVNPPCTTSTTFGGFDVNAAVRANGNFCDWFTSQNGSHLGVISDDELDATPPISADAFRIANQLAGNNLTYVQRMAVVPGTIATTGGAGDVVMLDAVAARDNHTAGSAVDASIFAGSGDKNADNPNTWNTGTSSVPQKNDIIDVGAHARRALGGTAPNYIPGDLYGYAFATTRNTNGDSHVDFEIFRTDAEVSGGNLINTGNDGGHTATKFAYIGGQLVLFQPGDLLVSVDYANGGTDPCASVWIWVNPTNLDGQGMTLAQYNTGSNANGTHTPLYEFTGAFYSGTGAAPYGYAEIIPYQNNINNCLIISTTNNTTSPLGAPWGNLTAQNAADVDNIQPLQLVEIAIDFTAFGLDLPDSLMVNGPCSNILGSLMVKTRSSGSFTAELKDFAGPFLFGVKREAVADAGTNKKLQCATTSVQLDGSSTTPGALYEWNVLAGSGGNILSGANTATPTVDAAGCYVLKVSNPAFSMCSAFDTVCVTGQSDTVPPTLNCPPAITVSCVDEIPAAASSIAELISQGGSASDNYSGIESITHSDSPLSGACGGSLTRTYTAIDSCGNASSCTQVITVNDLTPPSISGPADQTLPCNPSIPAADITLISANDACSNVTVIHVGDVVVGDCNRTLTRTYRATDACGNSSDWVQVFTYTVDTDAPVITFAPGCGTDVYLGCNASASDIESALGQATASDNCDANVQVVVSDGPTIFQGCYRIITRTFTATDDCGNQAVPCTRSVKWKADLAVPSITLDPAPALQQCNPTTAQIEASLGTASVVDVCGPVTLNHSDVDGGTPCARFKTRTWTAIDSCGNQAQAVSRTVNWREDLTIPVISITGVDTNLGCNPSAAQIEAALGTATVSDNCDANLQATSSDGNGAPSGCIRSLTRTFNATDACGNVAAPKSVTVTWKEDLTAPVVSCNQGGDVTVCEGATVSLTPSATDDCDGTVQVNCTYNGGAVPQTFPVGVNTVSCSASDLCGNTGNCSVTITVIPNPTCTLSVPSQLPVAYSTGNELSATSGSTFGTTTYTWSVSGSGWSITGGQGSSTIQYTAGTGIGTFTLTISNSLNGVSCSSTCDVSFESIQPVYCSYTQGYYGNAGGNNCTGGNTTVLLNAQLGAPNGDLVIGSGSNTLVLTLNDVSSGCIYRRLPGGGPSATIMGSNTCEISDGIATKGNGSYRNVLLAQTITLGLNLRVPGSSLASLPITGPYLVTLESNGSGCNDPASTPVAGTEIVRVIPDAVLAYLGSANTVGDLFALANRVLGADTTLAAPVPSLSAINQAVSAFNEGFDECRYFAGFYSTNPLDTVMSTTSSRLFNQAGGLSIEAYPNPAASNMVFSFSLSGYSSRAVLEILDINGARVAELFNRTADADYTHQIRFDTAALAEGIYFYRLTTDRGILTEKLSVLR